MLTCRMPSHTPNLRNSAPLFRYGAALSSVVLAALLNLGLSHETAQSHYFLFLAAILTSSFLCGLGPSLSATALATAISAYLFVAPFHALRVDLPLDTEWLSLFVIEGLVISFMGEIVQKQPPLRFASLLFQYGFPVFLALPVIDPATWH